MLGRVIAAVLVALAVMGAAAVYLVRERIEYQALHTNVVAKDRVALTKIVVARRDLFFGDRLKRGNVEYREWPTHAVPKGSFANLDKLIEEKRVVLRSITANEPILAKKITGTANVALGVTSKEVLGNCRRWGGIIPAVLRSLRWRCTRQFGAHLPDQGTAVPMARLPAKPQTPQQAMVMPKVTKGAPEVAPNPKAETAPKRVVVRRAPTLDLMTRGRGPLYRREPLLRGDFWSPEVFCVGPIWVDCVEREGLNPLKPKPPPTRRP